MTTVFTTRFSFYYIIFDKGVFSHLCKQGGKINMIVHEMQLNKGKGISTLGNNYYPFELDRKEQPPQQERDSFSLVFILFTSDICNSIYLSYFLYASF